MRHTTAMAPRVTHNHPIVIPTSSQLLAKLKWEAACERLAIAMEPRPDFPSNGRVELEVAVSLVQTALRQVQQAFRVYEE